MPGKVFFILKRGPDRNRYVNADFSADHEIPLNTFWVFDYVYGDDAVHRKRDKVSDKKPFCFHFYSYEGPFHPTADWAVNSKRIQLGNCYSAILLYTCVYIYVYIRIFTPTAIYS